MSEFSCAKKKTDDISILLVSDFMLFCSFILSHPLYFSYFVFFSPYLYKIFSFLSPLFFTTTLLLLAFLTLTPSFVNQAASPQIEYLQESKVSLLLTAYQTLVQTLRSKVDAKSDDDGFSWLEEFDVYKIVFETTDEVFETKAKEDCLQPVELEACIDKCVIVDAFETLTSPSLDEQKSAAEITRPKTNNNQVKAVVKIFEEFLQEKCTGFENLSSKTREKEVKPLSVEFKKGDQVQKGEELYMRRGSKAMWNNKVSDSNNKVNIADNIRRRGSHPVLSSLDPRHQKSVTDQRAASKTIVNPDSVTGNDGDYNYNPNTYSYYQTVGSMQREKEWRNTLACKLFEERHNGNDGGEGMDMLWETYEETDSNKVQLNGGSKELCKKLSGNQYYVVDDEDDYEEESDAQLCCLQALKFSSGKMNLGMRRPNLVKISKALKGIGWLHHISSSRHSKKGYR